MKNKCEFQDLFEKKIEIKKLFLKTILTHLYINEPADMNDKSNKRMCILYSAKKYMHICPCFLNR